jgi:catechol 2,3-dioxygenase-like lactoylglutathione lyase family enzyme
MNSGRALHFVFKVADRTLTAKFYREILGMKVTFDSLKLHLLMAGMMDI